MTRSRPCPHCNETVVLQVVSREKHKTANRRMALLVGAELPEVPAPEAPVLSLPSRITEPQVEPVPEASEPEDQEVTTRLPETTNETPSPSVRRPLVVMNGPTYEPQLIEGDAVDRLKYDPEVRGLKARLVLGVVGVAAAIALVLAWNVVDGSSSSSTEAVRQAEVAMSKLKAKQKKENSIGLRKVDSLSGTTASNSMPPTDLKFEHSQSPEPAEGVQKPASSTATQIEPIRVQADLGRTFTSQANSGLASGVFGPQ